MLFISILVLCFVIVTTKAQCPTSQKCMTVTECGSRVTGFMYECSLHTPGVHVCCPEPPETAHLANKADLVGAIKRPDLFPSECGIATLLNRITAGKNATIAQFPWMALLGYTHPAAPEVVQFLCGGSLITERYVLTAAHCMFLQGVKLTTVRLGELNLEQEIDCMKVAKKEVCAPPPKDIRVEDIISHKGFSSKLKNDIALIRLKDKVEFSQFIRPICLPFNFVYSDEDYLDKKFIVSGWGKLSSQAVGGSSRLQFALVKTWTTADCEKEVPPNLRPISATQLCANGNRGEDACKGDSGGPLSIDRSDTDNETLRTFQLGLVSLGAEGQCGITNLPSLYTKVYNYLSWIVENVKK